MSAENISIEEPKSKEMQRPKVSIGLPVYNSQKYLSAAIESILAQTFADFELIISDNASTDSTETICREYAAKDSRIRYYRNKTNIGGAKNHNLVYQLAKGEYFRFAAYDDVLGPDLLAKLVPVLDQNPALALCYSITMRIDENNHPTEVIDKPKATSKRPHERFLDLIGWDHDCEPIYGLIRNTILQQISHKFEVIPAYTDSDRTLLCHLSLYGQFIQIPEILFYKRIHPQTSVNVFPDWRQRMEWSNPNFQNHITLPHWSQFFHYLRLISYTPLPVTEKLYCYYHIGQWLFMEKRWGKMIKDLLYAGKKILLITYRKFHSANNLAH